MLVTKPFQLTTIRFSNFNEKARWALDRFKVPYTERAMMPGLHFPVAYFAEAGQGKADNHSSRYSTPIMRTDRGEVICDSVKIVRYVSERFADRKTDLHWHPDARPLEKHFSEGLAVSTRALAFSHAVADKNLVKWMAYHNVGTA